MKPLNKILAVIGNTNEEPDALDRAVSLAKKNQAALHIIYILDPSFSISLLSKASSFFQDLIKNAATRAARQLEILSHKLELEIGQEVTTKVVTGRMDLEVVAEVKRTGSDFVVKDCEASTCVLSSVFGSSDINLMRRCPCPVLILKPSDRPQLNKILVAVDKDEEAPENHLLNIELLRLASWLAVSYSCELHVLHVWDYPFESLLRSPDSHVSQEEADELVAAEEKQRRLWLHQLVENLPTDAKEAMDYIKPELHLVKGGAHFCIVEQESKLDIDLLVMGTVGRVGIPGLLMGNTSETILKNLKSSCLTVKPPGFGDAIS